MPSCCGILFSKFAKSEFLFVRNGGTLFEVVAIADSSNSCQEDAAIARDSDAWGGLDWENGIALADVSSTTNSGLDVGAAACSRSLEC